ncbi:TKL protein kinase [Pelomyxa schiedti]|nr:TKL protein kinase [Pelomyxa schiedti]
MSAGASSDTNEEEVILSYIESNPPPPLDNGPQAPPATPTETARDPAHDYGNPPPPLDNGPQAPPATPTETARDPAHDYGYEGELTNDYRGGITGSGDDPYYGYTDSSILEYDQQVVPSSFDGSSDHQSEAVPAAIVGSSSATDNPDGLHQAATTSNGPHKSSSCAHVSQNGAPQCGSPATRALPQPPVSKSGSEWHQAAHRDGAPREGGRVQDRLQSLHATQPQQQQGLRVSAVESGARPLPRPPMQSTSTVQCSQPTSAKPRPLPVPKTLTQSTQSQVQPTINPGPLPKPKLGAAEVLSTVHSKPASTPTPAANICSTSSVRPSLVPVPAATTQNKKISLSVSAPLKVLPPENPIPKAYSSPDSPSRPNIEASQLAQLALIARSAASKNGQSTEVQGHSLPIKGSSPPPAASAEVPPDKTSPSTDDLDSNPSALVFSSVFKKASLPSWEDQTRLLRQLAHYTTDQDEYNRKASEIQKMDEMRKMLEDKELLFAARNIAKLDEIIKSASRGPTTVSTSGAPLTSQIIPEGQKYHTEISFDQLKVGDLVGRGAAGKVYKGVYEGQEVAIKHYSEDNVQFNLKDFRKEIAIMSVLDHENLIRCIGACTADPQHLYIVTPLLKFSLASFLAQNEIDLVTCLDIAMGVTSGMCFLHAYHLIHRDLKTQNILLTDTLQVKIIDFGTSRIIDTASMMTTNIGTVQYMAPELFENKEYTEKADVYAFGIGTMYYMKCPHFLQCCGRLHLESNRTLINHLGPFPWQ